jgi:uncharacterized protein YcbX
VPPVGYPTVQARVRAIHVSPVKSLRLSEVHEAHLGQTGIAGDRRFILIDENGERVTLKKAGTLARATAAHDTETGSLAVCIDGGPAIVATPQLGDAVTVQLYDGERHGRMARGPWAAALSELTGRRLELVMLDEDSPALDCHPVSLLSVESCQELGSQNGLPAPDPRRFRPTLLLEGAGSHAEDGWLGHDIAAGEAVLRVVERDPRCVITTRNPETGDTDLDTLRMIASYRPPTDGKVWFGVYAEVRRPGIVRVGDPVHPLAKDGR